MSQSTQAAAPVQPAKIRLESWSWKGAFLVVFAVCIFAWGFGSGLRKWADLQFAWSPSIAVFVISGSLAALSFLLLSWRAVVEFLLSIRVGIAVLSFFLLGSILGVVVHPRDPDRYRHLSVEAAEQKHLDDFNWATGYFFYHLSHPYGIGLPKQKLPFEEQPAGSEPGVLEPDSRPAMENPLERIAGHYGARLAAQERSGMVTALNGRARGAEINTYIATHKDLLEFLYKACTRLQLNGTTTAKGAWASDWFAVLTGLLFIVVLTNTFRRGIARSIAQGAPGLGFVFKLPSALWWDLKTLFSFDRIGFVITHLGVLTSIAGGFYSRLYEQRGIVQLSVFADGREKFPKESYLYRTYSNEPRYLGPKDATFAVGLKEFRADYRDTIEVRYIEDPAPRTVPRYSYFEVWPGRQIGFDYDSKGAGDPKTIVRVLEHWPRSRVELDLVEREAGVAPSNIYEKSGAAVKLTFDYMGRTQSGFLFSGIEDLAVLDTLPGLRVRYDYVKDAAAQRSRLLAPFEGGGFGTIEVYTKEAGDRPVATAPLEVNGTFSFPSPKGTTKVKIVQVLPDARLMALPSKELVPAFANFSPDVVPPGHPGVELQIISSDGKHETKDWFYENERDSRRERPNAVDVDGGSVQFVIQYNHWGSPARTRYRIVGAPGEPLRIARVAGPSDAPGPAPEVIALQTGAPNEAGSVVKIDPNFSVLVNRRADVPRISPVIQKVPGDPDNSDLFFDRSPPSALIEVDGPEGKQQFRIAAEPLADTAVYAKRMAIRIFENTFELPREWKSKLEFMEVDPKTREWSVRDSQTIRVNDYAYYGGYRFFQTDANTQLPGYSGVGVVYDPGIESVIIGMWAIVAGVAYAFILKPLIQRKPRI